ncbi:MAG TPA: prolipoprotein diacylglyceryl transferase family protein, partial [Motilibacterales bacterium]|nr:prolipoprotein diacylglyceryl transferase family protein [Motilibacterales bacterium]
LYEALWLVGVAALVAWADRRWTLGHGRAFALYVATYCVGRLGMELLRIDPATQLGGIRINVFTAIVVGVGAVAYFVISARRQPGREAPDALRGIEAGQDAVPSPE